MKKKVLGVIPALVVCALIACLMLLAACSSQEVSKQDSSSAAGSSQNATEQNSTATSQDEKDQFQNDISEYDDVVAASDVSEEYLEEFNTCYSQASATLSNSSFDLECLICLRKVVEVEGSNIKVTTQLSGESEEAAEVEISASSKKTKVFLDGQPATLKDIEPGYLIGFYGKTMGIAAVAVTDTATGEVVKNPIEGVTFISAWTANQS